MGTLKPLQIRLETYQKPGGRSSVDTYGRISRHPGGRYAWQSVSHLWWPRRIWPWRWIPFMRRSPGNSLKILTHLPMRLPALWFKLTHTETCRATRPFRRYHPVIDLADPVPTVDHRRSMQTDATSLKSTRSAIWPLPFLNRLVTTSGHLPQHSADPISAAAPMVYVFALPAKNWKYRLNKVLAKLESISRGIQYCTSR